MEPERKKHRFDRKDAYYLYNADSMHKFIPYLMPNRTDNEASINELIDLEAINRYLEEKNRDITDGKYTIFHVVAAALAKTVYMRPKLNYFIQGHRMYERKKIILAFMAKKRFADGAEESMMLLDCKGEMTVNDIHKKIVGDVNEMRKGATSHTEDSMGTLAKLPRWMLKTVMAVLRWLDYNGRVPASLIGNDPNYSSVFISNLGSIKLHASYHHLNNWGTNSLFTIIGEKHLAPVINEKGEAVVKEVLPLGITLDERIADGYYYAKSIKLLKKLLSEPSLLEKPISEEVIYE